MPPSKLVFTFTWVQNRVLEHPTIETLVTVTFEDRDGRTLMTLRQSPFHAIGDRDGHGEGWLVYGAASAHHPTVTGGRAMVLYLLPGGAIEFTRS